MTGYHARPTSDFVGIDRRHGGIIALPDAGFGAGFSTRRAFPTSYRSAHFQFAPVISLRGWRTPTTAVHPAEFADFAHLQAHFCIQFVPAGMVRSDDDGLAFSSVSRS